MFAKNVTSKRFEHRKIQAGLCLALSYKLRFSEIFIRNILYPKRNLANPLINHASISSYTHACA